MSTKAKKNPSSPVTKSKPSGKRKVDKPVVPASETPAVVETPAPTTTQDTPASNPETEVSQDKGKRQVVRMTILGHPVTAVLRWMGKEGWSFDEAKKAVDYFGVNPSPITIRIQLPAGRKGLERGAPAPLTKEQIAELEAAKN